ncbi:MAG: Ig-like domain-containing protein [Candidatus Bathyarchaeota archaeon]|nr:Ig-like domain-containing protein [Candidatus Bathyarchaeota archaeon]MDH5732763.1 Ig-like domain-containing protein [Candidatus Bathyarchaeota archaeon]
MKIRKKAVFMLLLMGLLFGIMSNCVEASISASSEVWVNRSPVDSLSYTPNFPCVPQEPIVDPELLDSEGLTRVLILVDDDAHFDEVAKYLISMRVTPSFQGFYIVRGLILAKDVEQLVADVPVLTILKDREINYNAFPKLPTFSSIKEAINRKSAKLLQREGESFLGDPETTMREVVNLTGARDTWETYNINGTDTIIAIVDTGVDYGALSLGYWDVMAIDSLGFPAAFDADGECMVFTTLEVTAYSNLAGKFISTGGEDPEMYVMGDVYHFSDFWGGSFPSDMYVTGIDCISEKYHFGVMSQLSVLSEGDYWEHLFPVLVVDATIEGVYDTVYVDLSFDWAWLNLQYGLPFGTWPPEYSFADELPLTPTGNTTAARDFTYDGIYDLSAGSLGYFLDVWGLSPNDDDRGLVLKPVAEDGDYVVFVNDWFGHGTSCASCAVGRDIGLPSLGPGMAPGAKVMGVTALFIGDIIEAELWAAGFDLISGTEGWHDVTGYGTVWGAWNYTGNHKADIISNSWGFSDWAEWFATLGLPWYDVLAVFEDALTVPGYLDSEYPGTVIVHAGGNGGAGYGTFTEPGYGTLPIGVGASTSLNWTRYQFGFAGGAYDDIIPWSPRGPTAMGNVKPDVVNVGAFGNVSGPVWYGIGDGSTAVDLFGGTSLAAPLTAGAGALVIQAYNETRGVCPTPETTKIILKSSAKDLGYDALVQGAGRVDAFAAVELSLGQSGVSVFSPVSWDNLRPRIEKAWSMSHTYLDEPLLFEPPASPISDVSWFAGAVPPGNSTVAQFTVENTASEPVMVNITSVVHRQIGATREYSGYTSGLPLDWQSWGWSWGNLTLLNLADIPDETELMVVSLTVPYGHFDQNGDYSWDRRWGLCVLDWIDDGDEVIGINEVYLLNYGYAIGTSNEARVGFPHQKINGQPVIFIYQHGILDSVPSDISVKYYERSNWTWVNTPTTIAVTGNSSETFMANLTVPANASQGVYQGQIKIDVTGADNRTLAVPVSLQVPAVLSAADLVYDITPPSAVELYDPYSVNGYFDWGWRYEAGDWKQWLFDIQDPTVVAAFISCNWPEDQTDIDMFGIDPTGTIVDGAMSPNLYDGCFLWSTRTGTTEEFVLLPTGFMGKAITGLYTVLLHNVQFDGAVFPEAVSGKVELVKLTPSESISLTARSGYSTSQNFTISTGRKLTNMLIESYSALPTEISSGAILEINATDSIEFDVRTVVPEGTVEGTYPVFILLTSDEMSYPITILLNVAVDNTSPTVNVISPKNSSAVSGEVTIEAYASDLNGIEKVEFTIESSIAQMIFDSNSGHWIGALNTTTFPDGGYSLGVTAFDTAGNNHTTFLWITVDNTDPYAVTRTPLDYELIHGEAVVNITATDANLDKAELYMGGTLVATWTNSGIHTHAWTTTAYTDGTYNITLSVKDKAGNFATTKITVVVDNTVPLAEIREPDDQGFLRGIFNVTTWVYDVNLDQVRLEANGSVIDTWNLSGLRISTWNTTMLTDGVYVIRLLVDDAALNVIEKTVTTTVDNTSPFVSITSPEGGAELSGTVNINFTVEDNHIDRVLLYINDASIVVTGEQTYVWDTTEVGDGAYTIKLIGYDEAGNSAEASISVMTINVRLGKEFTRSMYLAIGTPLGFIIGAIIVYAFVKRRFPS